MSTLAKAESRTECCARLERLAPTAMPGWGRMTAHQMICHLSDSFKAATGEKMVSLVPGLFPRGVIKWVALHTGLTWARNVRTRPEVEQGRGGTPPVDWDADRRELLELICAFPSCREFAAHPMFGRMGWDDWQIWGYRHVDHHLRQFGV